MQSKTEVLNKSDLSGVIIGVSVIVISVIMYKLLRKKNITTNKTTDSIKMYEEDVKLKLEEIEKTFKDEAIGFYIQEKAFELNLNKADTKKLFLESGYIETLSSPTIDWTKEFSFMKNNIDKRDLLIENYMKEKNLTFCMENEFILNCFERYILLEAKIETEKLVKNWLK